MDANARTLDSDITRKPAEQWDRWDRVEEDSEREEGQPCGDESAGQGIHHGERSLG